MEKFYIFSKKVLLLAGFFLRISNINIDVIEVTISGNQGT
jgi:hypothetical protein